MHLLRPSVAACTLAAIASSQIPCWETNIQNNLALGDDAFSQTLPLGFSFPFGGVTYTDVVVCSNGYLWLGPQPPTGVSPDWSPTVGELTTEGPRIAPLWMDWDPSANSSGGVYFDTFAAGGGNPARAVVTWMDVFEYSRTVPLSMQITLLEGGDIIVHYDANMSVVAGGFGSNSHVVGASDGASTTNPVDFRALPIVTAGSATLHQVIPRGNFPLVGKDLQWITDGSGGYIVIERSTCSDGSFEVYGRGCPTPGPLAYEAFIGAGAFDLGNGGLTFTPAGGGYLLVPSASPFTPPTTTPLAPGDDTVWTHVLPGPITFPGAGTLTSVNMCSNGYIWMSANTTADFTETVAELLNQDPRLAPCWMDLNPDPNAGGGGAAYAENVGSVAIFTWDQVPEYAVGGSNTLQVKIDTATGVIEYVYGTVNQLGSGAVVGLSRGGGLPDPGATDLSALPGPLLMPAGATPPLTLAAQAGSRPAIGQTFNMEVGSIPSGTMVGAMIFGFLRPNPGVSLASLGMADCTRYVSLDVTFILPVSGATATHGLGIPNNNALLGTVLYAQAATFSSGFNPLGVITSNGGEIRVGR